MNNILLMICVVAFTSAQAQFDINEHLKKKTESTKKVEQKIPSTLLPKINQFKSLALHAETITFTIDNFDKVLINPQYNMPVVTTDMKQLKTMPNAGEDYFVKNFYAPGQQNYNDIPNGAAELSLPQKLQELLDKYKSK